MPKNKPESSKSDKPAKDYKIPISSILLNQITEFSPEGFFLLMFDRKGNPVSLNFSQGEIQARALEHALEGVVKENKFRRKTIMENQVFEEIDNNKGDI